MKTIFIIFLSALSISCTAQLNKKDSLLTILPKDFLNGDSAKVAIDVRIDYTGKTISATYQAKGSTTKDENMIAAAKRKALTLRWNASKDSVQIGTVIFNFRIAK